MNFNAVGIHGQLIHIDRARRLVIVINSAWPVATGRDYSAARSSLLRAIVTAVDADGGRKRWSPGSRTQPLVTRLSAQENCGTSVWVKTGPVMFGPDFADFVNGEIEIVSATAQGRGN